MKRALKLLLPALFVAEALLVWSGAMDLGVALLVVAGIEVLFLAAVVSEFLLVVRRYRRGRASGLDGWAALEGGLAMLLPRRAARLFVVELRLWGCLIRWISRRARLGENDFSYRRRSPTAPVIVMVALVGPVELLFWELLIPWAWLRLSLLVLSIYALIWLLGLHASLVALPHRLEENGLRLRYGAFAEGFVPYAEISEVEHATRKSPKGGEGLRAAPEEDALYLATGGRTDLTLHLNSPRAVKGLSQTLEPTKTIHLAADEPGELTAKLRHAGAAATVSPPAPV